MSKDQVTDKGAVTVDDEALDDVQGGVNKIDALTIKQGPAIEGIPTSSQKKSIGNLKYSDRS